MQQLERRESVALGQPHVLTEEEARWCVDLRQALKTAGIPAPASDYELAIFALVGKADTAKSVQRVTRFNATVAKHGLDVRSDGAASGAWGLEFLPDYASPSVGVDREGRPFFYIRGAGMTPSNLAGDGLSWYAQLCLDATNGVNCDLDRARTGYTCVYNCEGVRPRHMSMAVSMAEAELFQNALPVRPKQFLILDAPMLVRGFVKLMKPFLTQKMQSRIKFIRSDELTNYVEPSQLARRFGGAQEDITIAQYLERTMPRRHQSIEAVSLGAAAPPPPLLQARHSSAGSGAIFVGEAELA